MTITVKDANGANQTIATNDEVIAVVATAAAQATELAAIRLVGTRTYGAVQRVTVGAATAYSTALIATEVLLHATGKQYVLAVAGTGTPVVTNATGIPLEDGEKFHMRITSGQRIAVVRDSADGALNIAVVA